MFCALSHYIDSLALWFLPFWCFLFLSPIASPYDNSGVWLFWPLYVSFPYLQLHETLLLVLQSKDSEEFWVYAKPDYL